MKRKSQAIERDEAMKTAQEIFAKHGTGSTLPQPEGVVGIPMSKAEETAEIESVKAQQACCCVIT